jgi:dTDP-glucose 4,6-dehydratase
VALDSILVTGGAGFIGSCFVRKQLQDGQGLVVNLDAMTYAGNLASLPREHPRHRFILGDIADRKLVDCLLRDYQPQSILNFAAESHVDRSIEGPAAFVQTNVVGTFQLLEASLNYYRTLGPERQREFRFLHVSTDEVYGSLGKTGKFTERSAYSPNSPYAASKASSDMFVRAYHETFGLPTLITNCSNNYGPYQYPEKLIPVAILNALEGKPIPVYGDGQNVRDWLYVADHCSAIEQVLKRGYVGQTYNVGGNSERTNLDVVRTICGLVNELAMPIHGDCNRLITFVADRPGHDKRYAIDTTKVYEELGWRASMSFESGIRKTVEWYLKNLPWVEGGPAYDEA